MEAVIARGVFGAILGACFGSFANVLAVRLHNASSVGGRSRCPDCDAQLHPKHLVPILSWFVLKGRCAFCDARIHPQYPLIEFVGLILVAVAALRHDPFGPDVSFFVFEAVISIALLVLIAMDMRWKELPLEFMALIGFFAVAFHVGNSFGGGEDVLNLMMRLAASAGLAIVFFGIQWLLSELLRGGHPGKWLGSGDIWLGTMIGLVLVSWQLTGIAIYFAYMVGGSVVLFLLFFGKIRRGTRIPFAPALSAGLLLAMWYGDAVRMYIERVL